MHKISVLPGCFDFTGSKQGPSPFALAWLIRRAHNRVWSGGIIAKNKFAFGYLQSQAIGVGHAPLTDRFGQTCYRRAVSHARTTINVVPNTARANFASRSSLRYLVTGKFRYHNWFVTVLSLISLRRFAVKSLLPSSLVWWSATFVADHRVEIRARSQGFCIMHKVPAIISLRHSSPFVSVLPFAPSSSHNFIVFHQKMDFTTWGTIRTLVLLFNSHSNVLILDTTRG